MVNISRQWPDRAKHRAGSRDHDVRFSAICQEEGQREASTPCDLGKAAQFHGKTFSLDKVKRAPRPQGLDQGKVGLNAATPRHSSLTALACLRSLLNDPQERLTASPRRPHSCSSSSFLGEVYL